jgi:hypothetical protein
MRSREHARWFLPAKVRTINSGSTSWSRARHGSPGGVKAAIGCDPFYDDRIWFFANFAPFVVKIRIVWPLCGARTSW